MCNLLYQLCSSDKSTLLPILQSHTMHIVQVMDILCCDLNVHINMFVGCYVFHEVERKKTWAHMHVPRYEI